MQGQVQMQLVVTELVPQHQICGQRCSQKAKIQKEIYKFKVYFNEFMFHPYKNMDFYDKFQQRKIKQKQVIGMGKSCADKRLRTYLIHGQFFNYKNQEDRSICFTLRNVNPNVLRYSFGLINERYEPIKGDSISLYLNLPTSDESMDGFVHFYVELVSRKLYIEAGLEKRNQILRSNITIEKFTIYICFWIFPLSKSSLLKIKSDC